MPRNPHPPDVLPPDERERILGAVVARQGAEAISNRQMALLLGCSSSVWSQVRSGKYAAHRETKYLLRARQWLEDRSGRGLAAEGTFVETSIARGIMTVCARAWQLSRLGLVITRAGAGKTLALTEFARRRGRHAVLLRVGELISTKRGLLEELMRRLGLSAGPRPTIAEMGRAVRDHLAASYAGGKGTPFCLLVDEATQVKAPVLNLLREFADDPACRAAVVLAGIWDLDALIHKNGWIPGGTDQVRSRVAAVYRLAASDPLPAADVAAVAGAIVGGAMNLKVRVPAKGLAYLAELAQGDGALRAVENRLFAVRDLAEAAGADPTFSDRELDFAASILLGARAKFDHPQPPFKARAKAVA